MKDFMKWAPFIFTAVFAAVFAMSLAIIQSNDRCLDSPDIVEPRPQGSYTLTGVYSDGLVFDETGNVWEYYSDIPEVSAGTETPVVINFHGFGTPELEDDIILGLSYGLMVEAYCSSTFDDLDGETCYQFNTLDGEYFWVFTTEELGFTPVIDDQILICYTENGTPDIPYDDEVIYTRVL